MHDLVPTWALGGAEPLVEAVGSITIREVAPLALASLAGRLGQERACEKALVSLVGAVPGVGRSVVGEGHVALWSGPNQWLICGEEENLPDQVAQSVGKAASVTEQSGAWVALDLSGDDLPDLIERLCNVPIRTMPEGAVQRTAIHSLSCLVWRQDDHSIRVLGPRSAARNLHHAIAEAAKAIA